MSTTSRRPSAPIGSANSIALLVGTLGASYGVSQFLRNSVGVIAPNLAEELRISATQIGVLSSTFFFSFAAAQLPLGVAIDRCGPKRCMLVCGLVVIAGVAMFATASTLLGLVTARFLMGVGTSCYLMAPLALYARTFAPDRFTPLAGLQLGLGSIGTLMATAPLGLAAAAIGWRATLRGWGSLASARPIFPLSSPTASRCLPRDLSAAGSRFSTWGPWVGRSHRSSQAAPPSTSFRPRRASIRSTPIG